jgi:citrate lyase subunit beta/citryl-CoA lyase
MPDAASAARIGERAVETHGAVRDALAIAALPAWQASTSARWISSAPTAARFPPRPWKAPASSTTRSSAARSETAQRRWRTIAFAHGITRAIGDPQAVYDDARRARAEFGFLRMWSIHPAQIDPILRAMQPDAAEIEEAAGILAAAQAADWAPLAVGGKMHDLASYRYHWSVLERAKAAGASLPATTPTTTSLRTHGSTGRAQAF